ncbi:hypothetical protein ACFOOM_19885 [Streptomyces echinoruber]|uniref:hypothetical protein n=1 Tax=Streptomyces echinoruber TaxID=68898 RepID=UPI0036194699
MEDPLRIAALPYADEHATPVRAEAGVVRRGRCEAVERSFGRPGAAPYARPAGCAGRTAAGPRPLAGGSAFPGFRVLAAEPGRLPALAGRHRFSRYALVFRVEPAGPGRCRLRAGTCAAFPGLSGRLCRRLVIGTGGHPAGVRRLPAAARRRAEGGGRRTEGAGRRAEGAG